MSGSRRGLWAGFTFLFGFSAAIWVASAALGGLRGPRAGLMRELNQLRGGAGVPALRPDAPLGRVAQQHAADLARGSALAGAQQPGDLERSARSQGWKGRGPLRRVHVQGVDAVAALRESFPGETLADPEVKFVGVGVSPAEDGRILAVVLLAP